ncbi:ThuA domain-containing protein [Erythrobacter crassostreae]|uniref:ThuA domain-containing protein n=1 Tax=Erythrobacter crassostreae TaxID=2828328 RepID=A0A9X1F5D2_9SPHN|nr:ThuA domain-containing protein [Erythrobacter crassostrea]MBV7259813.1 ThuA domain-containing protein [Erythrobacter crassostrea]
MTRTTPFAAVLSAAVALSGCAPSVPMEPIAPVAQPAHDQTAPTIFEYMAQPAILVFSKTRDFRHNEGIAGGDRFFAKIATDRSMGLFTTVNGAVFNEEQLARFSLVVFNNVTGDALSDSQENALQSWVEAGGGFIAIHGSGDASHEGWPWYDSKLIGPEFIGHPADPQFQTARVVNLSAQHPVMAGLPAEWEQEEEWYSFDDVGKLGDARVLLGIDETTYSPRNDVYGDVADLRMGGGPKGHPIAWLRCSGQGRFFYSAIGHSFTAYDVPENRKLLSNAVDWALRKTSSPEDAC